MNIRKILLVLIITAFLLRLSAAVYWQEYRCVETESKYGFFFMDSESYWELARTIAERKPYEFSDFHWQIFRTPGYPILLAPLFWLFGDFPPILAARFFGAVLGTATIAAAVWLSWLLFRSRLAAVFTAVILSLDPLQILSSILVLSEAPFCFFMVLQIVFWIKFLQTHKTRFASVSGVFYAAATLCRPSWLYFVPFALLVWFGLVITSSVIQICWSAYESRVKRYSSLYRSKAWRCFSRKVLSVRIILHLGVAPPELTGTKPRSKAPGLTGIKNFYTKFNWWSVIKQYVVMLLTFCVVMSPWCIRNYKICGHFVPTSLQLGPSLYDGLNPNATGASEMSFVEKFREDEKAEPSLDPNTEIYEYRVDYRMKRAATDWAKSHPARVAELAAVKFVRMWNIVPNEPAFSSLYARIIIFLTYTPVLVFAIIGTAITFRQGYLYWLCWLPALYFTSLHIIFVSSLRYRVPPMILLTVLAGYAAAKILNRSRFLRS